jgi:hypothetical protein
MLRHKKRIEITKSSTRKKSNGLYSCDISKTPQIIGGLLHDLELNSSTCDQLNEHHKIKKDGKININVR